MIFLGFDLEYARIFILALIGGSLGVLFMVPLRKQLIVDEHGNLAFPEGTACADVLIAGEKGGSFASRVFFGLGLGALYAFFQNENLFGAWPGTPEFRPDFGPQHVLKGSSIKADATSEYLGVGYIIGPKTAGVMFAGGVLSWLVLMPLIYFFGKALPGPVYPGTVPIGQMGPSDLWITYIRPMGAGAVAAAGLITLIKTLPTIFAALSSGFKNMRKGADASAAKPLRTEDDFSMGTALIGSALLVVLMFFFLYFKPVPGAQLGIIENLAASLLIVFFGFLFVTVSSRIVGLIGSSANPVSGMTIATLMATRAIFLVAGWTAPAFGALAITVGGVVCIASCEAGDTSQDLKTGFLIGATPRKQRYAFLIGILVSTFAVGYTLQKMNTVFTEFHAAPQAWDLSVPHSGVVVQSNPEGLNDRIPVIGADKKTTMHAKSEYIVLNALGSSELADGKYLYSPATKQIEVQWIPGIGSEKSAAPPGPPHGHGHQRHPQPQASLGTGAAGRLHRLHRRAAGHSLAGLRRGRVSLHRHHAGHLCRRRHALDGRRGSEEGGRRRQCRGRRLAGLTLRLGTDRRRRHRRPDRRGAQGLRDDSSSRQSHQPHPLPHHRQPRRFGPGLCYAGRLALLLCPQAAEEVTASRP